MITTEYHGDVLRVEMSITFLGRSMFPINAYIVDSLLIDTGAANLSGEFLKRIHQHSIETVVNTHAHPNHIGANYAFPFVFVHPEGFERLKNPLLEMKLQRFLYGLPRPSVPREVPSKIQAGDHHFQVLYTPGHCSDHVSFFEPEKKWAFTGDLLLWGVTREVFIDVKIYDAIRSLRRLAELDIDILFPGHGRPFTDPTEALAAQVETLESIGDKVRGLHEDGLNAEEIRNHLFGRERLYVYLLGGKFSALNLVKSYLQS